MGDMGDIFREFTEHAKQRKREATSRRLETANNQYEIAYQYAVSHNLTLRKCSDYHYILQPNSMEWQLNFYPTTTRIYRDPNKGKDAPHITINRDKNDDITLLNFVVSVVATLEHWYDDIVDK